MNKWTSTPQFEESIRQSFGVPDIRPEFVDQVYDKLMQRATKKTQKPHPFHRLRPAWTITLTILTILIIGTLMIGPQYVYAAVAQLFGYIPGVGIVDESSPIRVLAEPVSVTRDGFTITVTSATLTGDKTYIDYRIFGVPGSAYPKQEDVRGCMQEEYLRLADGSQLTQVNFGYQPVPAGVDEAVFVIPCIGNTLPGKAPENWELPLRFVPAPADLTVIPVFEELTPSPPSSLSSDTLTDGTPAALADSSVTVSKVIETDDGYILIGQFQPQIQPGEWTQTGGLEIVDATGKKVSYTYPQDVNEAINQQSPLTGWAAQFKAAGLVYPLTIRFSGVALQPADPSATAKFTFDAGSNPQPGQVWSLNQDIQLAGHTLTLVSIRADSRGGYSFDFQVDPQMYSVGLQIEGYTPNGGGGGGGGGLTNGKFNVSLSYSQLPTGVLTVTLSNLTLISDPLTWEGQWSPATLRTDLPANPSAQPGVCLTADSLAQLKPAPADLTSGMALMYEQLADTDQWGLVLYNLDGSQKQVVVSAGNWGTLSPDGSKVAYSALDNGIHIVDLASQTEKVIPDAGGFDLHWSPDSQQIAYIKLSDNIIDSVFVVDVESGQARQISDWSYELAAGWSPDSAQIYYVAPYTGGAAWKVYRYDLASSETQELFTIENGTPKALNPKLSPDGEWIAYRGRDNSSLYLVHPDGSDMHLVLDNVGAVGVEWSQSGWLGVSLQNINSDKSTNILLKPDGCEAYQLPGLSGELEGLFLP
jgi:Tol biopolymer transport system component